MLGRLAAAVSIWLYAAELHAGDSRLDWNTIESPHFVIHYYDPNRDIAERLAVVAERAHRVLAPVLRHEPAEKTQITITDDTDGSNGFASVAPRNQIGVFAVAPDALSTLNDHDDWLYGLIAHEYSHILHLDTMSGIPVIYNKIAGKVWAPNNVQPRWFIEGLATYEESKRSASGRTRNAIFDMYLRVAVLHGIALDLDAISSGPLFWPHGDGIYLYGSFFLKYIADRFGDDVIARISHDYGGTLVPYGLNRSVAHATGEDYLQLYAEWLAYLGRRYGLVRDAVLARGLIEGRKLTNTGEENTVPRYLRDGSGIVWSNTDGHEAPVYRFIPRGGDWSKQRRLVRFDGGGKISPLPDGRGAVVERGITFRTNYGFTDLFRIDWDGRSERLTHGLRAATPDVSPDGTMVAFTVNGGSRRRLAIMPIQPDAAPEIVWSGERWDQAFDPAWSPDGKSIAFAAWTRDGYTDLYLYDVEGRTTRRLTADRAIDATPRFSPDGRLLYFSSDRTGIYNIFALDLGTGALLQVTNVLGGAFSEDVAPDGRSLVYYDFDGDGYELYELALDPARFLPAEPYIDDRPDPTRVPDDETPVGAPRTYRSVATALPLTWSLSTTVDSYGNSIAASTSGGDIAGLWSWYVSTSYGETRGDLSFGAAAFVNKFWPGLSIAAGRGYGFAGGLVVNGRNTAYHAENWSLDATVSLPVLRLPEVSSDLSLTYDLGWLRDLDALPMPDPNAPVVHPPPIGVSSGFTLRWSVSTVRGFVYTIGPVEGSGFSLAVHFASPEVGSRSRIVELFYRWDQFFRVPIAHQSLAFSLQGGLGQSDQPGDVRYFLGGVPQQDLVNAIIHSSRAGYGWLHGYPAGSVNGNQYHLMNVEYRIPIQDIERGLVTLPGYVRRVHLAALFDVAGAYDGAFDPSLLKYSVGAALRVDTVIGFIVPGTFDLGVARGVSRGGDTEVWLLLTGGI